MENTLKHHGIKGQKWGVRRFQRKDGTRTSAGKKRYTPTGMRAWVAKRENDKIDKSFNNWKTGAANRDAAITSGKRMNEKRIAYETDRKNKVLKSEYKAAKKQYKSDLKKVTTYRKGRVKGDVGSDMSRKYRSEAKKVQKRMSSDPDNKALRSQYNKLMSKYGTERARARKQPERYARLSNRTASIKRKATMTVKTAVATGTALAGVAAVDNVLKRKTGRGLDAASVQSAIIAGARVVRQFL